MRKTIQKLACLMVGLSMVSGLAACGGGPAPESIANAYEVTGGYDGAPAEATADMAEGGSFAYGMDDMYTQGEAYQGIVENRAQYTREEPMLTFSLKVDTASYTNVARYIENGQLPPADGVRTEELINYFNYDQPVEMLPGTPFGIYTEVGPSPFNADSYLAFIRVKTQELDKAQLPTSNLTFLIDTSGSMYSYDKLPLLVDSLKLLVEVLDENDLVSIVTYASGSGVLLDSVSAADKDTIYAALDSLSAGGSTAGADGINTAYELAAKNYMADGNNRVILASDGDFNVGISDVNLLEDFIADKRDTGVYLSVLGFGTGNLNDAIMESLAANGNGNYSYINNLRTAQKVLVDELAANLFTVADDVKAQVEFNPEAVETYRLIGYENRMLANEDFDDDTVDAGEIGAGTDVVMLFEFTLAEGGNGGDVFDVNIRYKDPGESESRLATRHVNWNPALSGIDGQTADFRFASAVAAFGHLLRGSDYTGEATVEEVIRLAMNSLGGDDGRYRFEFVSMLYEYEKIAA